MLTHYIRRVVPKPVTTGEVEKNEDGEAPKEEIPVELTRVNFKTDKFYLDEKYFPRAKSIIDRGEEPLSRPILSSVAFLVVFMVLFFTMPSILTLLF